MCWGSRWSAFGLRRGASLTRACLSCTVSNGSDQQLLCSAVLAWNMPYMTAEQKPGASLIVKALICQQTERRSAREICIRVN